MKTISDFVLEKLKLDKNISVISNRFYELTDANNLELLDSGFTSVWDYKIYDIPDNSEFMENLIQFADGTENILEVNKCCEKINKLCENVLNKNYIDVERHHGFDTSLYGTLITLTLLDKPKRYILGKITIYEELKHHKIGFYIARKNNENKVLTEKILTQVAYIVDKNL